MEETKKQFPVNVVNISGIFLLIITLVIVFIQFQNLAFPFSPYEILAFLLAAVAIISSYLNNGLPFTLRHIYNLHYAAIAALLVIGETVFFIQLVWLDHPFIGGLMITCATLATYWTFIHLIPSAFNRRRDLLVTSLLTWCLVAFLTGSFWVFVLASFVFLASLVYQIMTLDKSSPVKGPTNAAWAILAYGSLNFIILIGLGGFFITWIYTVIQSARGDSFFETGVPFPFLPVVLRIVAATLTGLITLGISLLWIQRKQCVLDWLVWGALIWALALMFNLGAFFFNPQLIIHAFILLIFLTYPTRYVSRTNRLPFAVFAGTIAFTIILRLYHVPFYNQAHSVYLFLLDLFLNGGVWLIGYFFGIRLIRNFFEADSSTTEPPTQQPVLSKES